jgi:hypothetical protein
MSEKEFKEFREVLKKQQEEVKASKQAAKKLLVELGILTPKEISPKHSSLLNNVSC